MNLFDFVIVFKKRSGMGVAFIVGLGVTIKNALRQQTGGLFAILPDEEMIMVVHQAIGNEGQIELAGVVFEPVQEE